MNTYGMLRSTQGIETFLREMGVGWIVLPSMKRVITMWRDKFRCGLPGCYCIPNHATASMTVPAWTGPSCRFIPLTLDEGASLESIIICPDFDSCQLVKKDLTNDLRRSLQQPPQVSML